MVPAAARRRVTDTHGSFPTDPKCSTIAGMMSATIVWSSEKKNTLDKMADTKGACHQQDGDGYNENRTYLREPISSHESVEWVECVHLVLAA